MKKLLATVMAASSVLIVSGCNGSPSETAGGALPQNAPISQAGLRPHDTINDLEAGGATFPAYAYNLASQPVGTSSDTRALPGAGSLFAKLSLGKGAHTYYCLTGSGTGMGIFTTGMKGQSDGSTARTTQACAPLGATPTGFGARVDPPDFAGSDVAMASTDYASPNYVTVRKPTYGEPFQFPVIGGPIVFAYTPQSGFPATSGRIHLSEWTYCAIANGTITDWNDAAITKDNGGSVTGGSSQPITFFFRSDGSGTSYNFTYHLNAVCQAPWPKPYNKAPYESSGHSAVWTYGYNKNWPGPGSSGHPDSHFIGESGNPGVLAAIQTTPYGTGYVEGAYAASASSPSVAQALVQAGHTSTPVWSDPTNATQRKDAFKVVGASAIQYGMGSDGNPISTSTPYCILYIDPSKFTNPKSDGAPNGSYPINAVSYLLFYGTNPSHFASKSKLINFMLGATARTIEAGLEYTPLNTGVTNAALNALNGTGNPAPCLKS